MNDELLLLVLFFYMEAQFLPWQQQAIQSHSTLYSEVVWSMRVLVLCICNVANFFSHSC